MFADDTKIYGKVNSQEDIDIIQKDLENLQVWSEEWLLKFNAGKCKTMHMGTWGLEILSMTTIWDKLPWRQLKLRKIWEFF